jgi:hypothetical protein
VDDDTLRQAISQTLNEAEYVPIPNTKKRLNIGELYCAADSQEFSVSLYTEHVVGIGKQMFSMDSQIFGSILEFVRKIKQSADRPAPSSAPPDNSEGTRSP